MAFGALEAVVEQARPAEWAFQGAATVSCPAEEFATPRMAAGELGAGEERITLDGVELDGWAWVSADRVTDYVIPRLARRLTHAYRAHRAGTSLYLEHGAPAMRDSGLGER